MLKKPPGERVVAKKNVTVNEQVFQGHFPGNSVLPGVLIIESLAQAGAVALLSMPEFKGKTAAENTFTQRSKKPKPHLVMMICI